MAVDVCDQLYQFHQIPFEVTNGFAFFKCIIDSYLDKCMLGGGIRKNVTLTSGDFLSLLRHLTCITIVINARSPTVATATDICNPVLSAV